MRAAAVYFALVFGAGFLLAFVRIPLLVPRLGIRYAELCEVPVMLIVIFLSARWLSRHALAGSPWPRALAAGCLALALMLLAEIALGLALGAASIESVLLDRDPVSGAAYYVSLAIFAVLPALFARRPL